MALCLCCCPDPPSSFFFFFFKSPSWGRRSSWGSKKHRLKSLNLPFFFFFGCCVNIGTVLHSPQTRVHVQQSVTSATAALIEKQNLTTTVPKVLGFFLSFPWFKEEKKLNREGSHFSLLECSRLKNQTNRGCTIFSHCRQVSTELQTHSAKATFSVSPRKAPKSGKSQEEKRDYNMYSKVKTENTRRAVRNGGVQGVCRVHTVYAHVGPNLGLIVIFFKYWRSN